MSNLKNFIPVPVMVIDSEDQAKIYLHHTRMRIIALIAPKAMTVSQVAAQLGVHPANLTHHFRRLEEAGLIRLTEKRETGRNLEKYYRAAAYSYRVSWTPEEKRSATQASLHLLQDDLEAALSNPALAAEEVVAFLAQSRIDEASFNLFFERLKGLVNEFQTVEAEQGRLFNLNISLYPTSKSVLPQGDIHLIMPEQTTKKE